MSTTPTASAHVCTPPQTPSEYVAQLPAWDGKHRLDAWMACVLKKDVSENDHSLAATGRWFITDMVARAMPPYVDANGKQRHGPGCPSPYLLILVGPGGSGKSNALKTLAGQWFDDSNVLDDYDPDVALEGTWLHGIPEYGFGPTRLKDFITRTHYHRRTPYTAQMEWVPRTCMLAATAHGTVDSLDPGRWMRPVTLTRKVADIAWLSRNRDQLFAEAKTNLLAQVRE